MPSCGYCKIPRPPFLNQKTDPVLFEKVGNKGQNLNTGIIVFFKNIKYDSIYPFLYKININCMKYVIDFLVNIKCINVVISID